MRSRSVLVLVGLLALVVARVYAAATTTTIMAAAGGLPPIVLTVNAATTGDVVATDDGSIYGKRAQIIRTVSNAQTKYVLVRIQRASNGLFIDEIASETTTALATRIAAFDLSSSAPGHPSPTHDAVDDALSTAMVGYTGS